MTCRSMGGGYRGKWGGGQGKAGRADATGKTMRGVELVVKFIIFEATYQLLQPYRIGIDSETPPNSHIACQHKKRRVSRNTCFSLSGTFSHLEAYVPCLPTLEVVDYYTQPFLKDLATREYAYPGFCSRVLDFIVGRLGYGSVKFGLNEDDEEDIMMEDSASAQDLVEMNHGEISDGDEESQMDLTGIVLSHSLPVHLRLDPRMSQRSTPPAVRKTPLAFLEYKHGSLDSNSPGTILMAQENKAMPPKTLKEGFKLDLKHETPVTKKHSRNIIDTGLFMGRSFRVGYGPNGTLVHAGTPFGSNGSPMMLSSIINIEKVAIDSVVRDENNKVREELVDMAIDSPLGLHKGISHQTNEIEVGSFNLRLQKLVPNCLMLPHICRSYVDIIDKENGGKLKSLGADSEEEMVQDVNEASQQVDLEALPLIWRAEFSYWLQENVSHRACESIVNRTDVAQQLDCWRINRLDYDFIKKNRIRLYELFAGNIHGAFHDVNVDLKRFPRLFMWYHLEPSTSLPTIFHTYQHLLDDGKAPYPVTVYIDEGLVKEAGNSNAAKCYDLSYYLMLLHASEESKVGFLKPMFSAFSSTHDPLDYHMIWHQCAVLEAVGAISSKDLHVLDMRFFSQLLCLGQCHWAMYVVLHMPQSEDFPYVHSNLIWEILFQYCESWSSQESQCQAIVNLGIPKAWLHEAMELRRLSLRRKFVGYQYAVIDF
ncbi:hypothetical protein ACFXTI_022499 [Malus domestica]